MKRIFSRIGILMLWCTLALPVWSQNSLPDGPTPQPGAGANTDAPDAPDPAESKLPLPPVSPQNTGTPAQQNTAGNPPEPSPAVTTVPPNKGPDVPGSGPDELSRIIVNVNYVLVPVRVKDSSGRPVPGLTVKDFSVYENDQRAPIKFFTSDPFPLSAAVIVDVGMPEIALKKVQETFSALSGSFSPYDEISIYTVGNTVHQQQDYLAAAGERTSVTLKSITRIQGRNSGPPAYNPMTTGPTVNGRVFDPGQQRSIDYAPPKDEEPSRVLNDAILTAARDLSRRDRARRKIIFVISDGREQGSKASYSDVLKVLLTNEVSVYAVAVDTAAIPGYNKLGRIRLPRQGVGNILPKYASATGGEVFTEFDRNAIESAYSTATDQARNQYTIGYTSPQPVTASGSFRTIEVRVGRGGLKVYSRAGYYPLPPKR